MKRITLILLVVIIFNCETVDFYDYIDDKNVNVNSKNIYEINQFNKVEDLFTDVYIDTTFRQFHIYKIFLSKSSNSFLNFYNQKDKDDSFFLKKVEISFSNNKKFAVSNDNKNKISYSVVNSGSSSNYDLVLGYDFIAYFNFKYGYFNKDGRKIYAYYLEEKSSFSFKFIYIVIGTIILVIIIIFSCLCYRCSTSGNYVYTGPSNYNRVDDVPKPNNNNNYNNNDVYPQVDNNIFK